MHMDQGQKLPNPSYQGDAGIDITLTSHGCNEEGAASDLKLLRQSAFSYIK